MAVDILSGVITGGLFADEMRSMYHDPDVPSQTGHFFMAIDLVRRGYAGGNAPPDAPLS